MDKFDKSFIVLNRKIVNWEWYQDVNVKTLFIHCILKANWEKANWRGIQIERGQFVTSLGNLSNETGLTVKQVRTALKKLKITGEVAHKGQDRYSIITVKNYNLYQDKDTQRADKGQANGQAEGKQRATTNNNNNNNNIYTTTTIYKENLKKFLEENKDFEIYGEYQNVFLTKKQKGWLLARIGSEKKLNQYIESLSENIACTKDVDFDFQHLEMHKIRIYKYFDYERKHRGQNKTVENDNSDKNYQVATEDNYNPFQ